MESSANLAFEFAPNPQRGMTDSCERGEAAGAVAEGIGVNTDSAFGSSSTDVIQVAAGMCCFECRTHHFRCEWFRIAEKM